MLVFMAIDAEIFPVRSVGRIIVVIPVFVVNGQEMPVIEIELPPALGTDESVDLERLLPIIA